jgi:hypothetical protein
VDREHPGVAADVFAGTPRGVILHGSRSGHPQSTHAEYVGTANYAVDEPNGLGWNATIGDDEVAIHILSDEWGWNARTASSHYLAVEFAQPTVNDPISDAQVRAFCWWWIETKKMWPSLSKYMPTHAELDGTIEYGGYTDGKTDVFPKTDARATELRQRIISRLVSLGV